MKKRHREKERKEVLEELSDVHDKELRDILKGGAVVETKDGEAVRISPAPAYFNVARQRLKDLGINPMAQEGDAASELAAELKAKGADFKALPPHSDEPDAATG